jgi:hypothetical protein
MALPGFGLACTSSNTGTMMDGGSDAFMGTVSFKNDLAPKFASACGLSSSCHQDTVTDPKVQRVFLGCNMSATNNCSFPTSAESAPTVYTEITTKTSQEEATMMHYITANNPDKSYLLRKIEGTQTSLTCVPVNMDPIVSNAPGESAQKPCGELMPLGNTMPDPILPPMVRAWINQGALNN